MPALGLYGVHLPGNGAQGKRSHACAPPVCRISARGRQGAFAREPILHSFLARRKRGRAREGLGARRGDIIRASLSEAVQAQSFEEDDLPPTPAAKTVAAQLRETQTPISAWLPSNSPATSQRIDTRAKVPSRVLRLLLRLMTVPADLCSVLGFRLQGVMMGSTLSKMLMFFAVGIPLCSLGGAIYSWASGRSLLDGIINAYGALYKVPGVTVIGEINSRTAHIMNLLWMVGTFLFGAVIAIITQDIIHTVESIRHGIFPVIAANHTLILNWSSEMLPLLRQIAANQTETERSAFAGPVVVLADKPKPEMDEILREGLRGLNLDWHTRRGQPHAISDLAHVAAGQAKTLILLKPDNEEDAGERQVATVLGLQAARSSTRPRPFLRLAPQCITVQVPDTADDRGLVKAAMAALDSTSQKLNLTDLSGRQNMSMLLAHSAVQPGVASVVSNIVQQAPNTTEFYIKAFPQLEGRTFASARRAFDRAVVCGYLRQEGSDRRLFVNPPDSDVLQEADKLIALSPTGFFYPAEQEEATARRSVAVGGGSGRALVAMPEDGHASKAGPNPRHLVVAWWVKEDIKDLCEGLSQWLPAGSTVTVICSEKPVGWPSEHSRIRKSCSFDLLEGDPVSRRRLEEAGVGTAAAVILGDPPGHSKDADALTLSLMLLVQDIAAARERDPAHPVHVVGVVRQAETVDVANYVVKRLSQGRITAELLQPDELVSGLIVQVASDPDMADLLGGFIRPRAEHEIYLRPPSAYGLVDAAPASFAYVGELARLRDEVAIGYAGKGSGLLLAPPADLTLTFAQTDFIIAIGTKAQDLQGHDGPGSNGSALSSVD